jgi:8-oxo-dGTP diphosphatase
VAEESGLRKAVAEEGGGRGKRVEESGWGGDTPGMPAPRIRCVGAVIHDADQKLLLIRRGHPPGEGLWSLPGGRVEPGESDHAAVIREIGEETGLRIVPGALLGSVERPGPNGTVFDIRDYECVVTGGELAAGDDAADVRWVSPGALARMAVTPGLVDALTEWNVLPGRSSQRDSGLDRPG